MPATSNVFTLPVQPDGVIEIIRRLCAERGWQITQLTEGEVVARVALQTKKASVVLAVTSAGDQTAVRMDGHVAGIGPVVKRMLQEKLDAFRGSLVDEAGRALPGGL